MYMLDIANRSTTSPLKKNETANNTEFTYGF